VPSSPDPTGASALGRAKVAPDALICFVPRYLAGIAATGRRDPRGIASRRAIIGLLCLVLLAPLLLVDVPPLLDYPNHLTRGVVLAFGPADPILSRIYAARWAVIPNLGTDLLLPPLLHLLPVHIAGRLLIGIALLLPVLGTIAYSRASFLTPSAWPLASGLVAYNEAFLLGFLNFTAALGIALLLAAGWHAWREHHPIGCTVLASIGGVVLFFCHLMGLFFFWVLILSYEAEQLSGHRPPRSGRLAALAPLLAVSFGLYLISPLAPVALEATFASPADKAEQLLAPFVNYLASLDVATAAAVGTFLLVSLATRRCRVAPGSRIALLLLAALCLAAPSTLKGTQSFDMRFAIMGGFLLFGALMPVGLAPRMASVVTAVFALLLVLRTTIVGLAWYEHRQDLGELRRVIANVEPGARVFIASVPPERAPSRWRNGPLSRRLSNGTRLDQHLPALLTLERRAYWPFLFDNQSQQPVMTLPPYQILAERAGAIASLDDLAVPGRVNLCGFDYLLLLEAAFAPDLAKIIQDRLVLQQRTGFAALFRISAQACLS
jgi:hypothetical protein